jgi:hypothetical protein
METPKTPAMPDTRKHYKIEYAVFQVMPPMRIYTLIGYDIHTDNPGVAADWLRSVQAVYPNLPLRLSDPVEQALVEALSDADEIDTTPQYGSRKYE